MLFKSPSYCQENNSLFKHCLSISFTKHILDIKILSIEDVRVYQGHEHPSDKVPNPNHRLLPRFILTVLQTSCVSVCLNRNLQTLCPARRAAGDHQAKWLNCEVQLSRQQSGSRVKDDPGVEKPQTARLDFLQHCDQDHLSQVWVRLKTTESHVIGRMLNITWLHASFSLFGLRNLCIF